MKCELYDVILTENRIQFIQYIVFHPKVAHDLIPATRPLCPRTDLHVQTVDELRVINKELLCDLSHACVEVNQGLRV